MVTATGVVFAAAGGVALLVLLSRAAAWAMFALAAVLLSAAAGARWAIRSAHRRLQPSIANDARHTFTRG